MSDQAQPKVLNGETAKRLAAALKEVRDTLKALPPGSIAKLEKYDELAEITAEINSYFSN